MYTLSITLTGQTDDDLQLALEEVSRLVKAGNTSAMNRNETGSFSYLLHRVPDADRPAKPLPESPRNRIV